MFSYSRIILLAVTLCYAGMGAYAQIDSVMQSVTLEGVEVQAAKYTSKVRSRANGELSVDMQLLGILPQLLGTADPIRYSQMLPEIQTNGELRGGVNLQGSENSHNLLSIGGVPIYNACHLLGFFSTFNSSHFDRFTLRKMNDAKGSNRIGGELSMELPHTVPDTVSGEWSAGLLSSQGTLRLPLGPKTLLNASFRTSYINRLYSRWLRTEDMAMAYSFSDFNLTLLHAISEQSQLVLDYYGGFDRASLGESAYTTEMKADWGNQMVALHHRYRKNKLRWDHTLYLTQYKNDFSFGMQDISYKLPSRILDVGLKQRGEWNQLSWGADLIYHDINPQSLKTAGTVVANDPSDQSVSTAELSLYASCKIPISTHLRGECGLRGTLFGSKAAGMRCTADPSLSITYSHGDVELFAGYAMKHQFLFQTGFSDAGLPTEFWLSSDKQFAPQYAHTVNIGSSCYLLSRRFKLQTNLFYKRLYHQMEYLGSVMDFVNTRYALTDYLRQGKGRNYGFSLILNKCTGKLSGWVSYTYTRARRTMEGVNQGRAFAPVHERPHELNLVWSCSIGRHWDLGATLVYASGTPFTPVKYLTLVNGSIVSHFGDHHGARLHPYGRLDLSVNYKWKSRWADECGINFSLYNAAARNNELFYYISWKTNGDFSYRPRSFFVDILPSISYFCKF